MAGERTLRLTILGDSDSAVRAIGRVETATTGLQRTMQRATAVAGGFLAAGVIDQGASALIGFLGDAKTAASDLNESINAVNVIFGESADEILRWGEANATAFGLSQRAFNQMATPLGAMLKNTGMDMEDVERHTISLTQRAADMASVFNTDVEDALAAIQAGLRGEIDPLEQYGVKLSAAAVQQRALADTGKEAVAQLNEQELAAARLALIYEQTAAVAGDFANTSGEVANAERIVNAEIEQLNAQIGQHLLPLTLELTKAKLALVKVLAEDFVPQIQIAVMFVGKLVDLFERLADGVNSVKTAMQEIPVVGEFAADRIPDVSPGGLFRTGLGGALDAIPGVGAAKDVIGWISMAERLIGGARAAGGPVKPGRAYLVGENGPELFTSKTGGVITPPSIWRDDAFAPKSGKSGTELVRGIPGGLMFNPNARLDTSQILDRRSGQPMPLPTRGPRAGEGVTIQMNFNAPLGATSAEMQRIVRRALTDAGIRGIGV